MRAPVYIVKLGEKVMYRTSSVGGGTDAEALKRAQEVCTEIGRCNFARSNSDARVFQEIS